MEASADVAELRRIALAEMREVAAVPPLWSPLRDAALEVPLRALVGSLASLDADIGEFGLVHAAVRRLAAYRVPASLDRGPGAASRRIDGNGLSALPSEGPLLVVANHPGLFDCLALFAAIQRDDLTTLAAQRPLFAALPNLSRCLTFVSEGPLAIGPSAVLSLRRIMRYLSRGGAVLHFPAGRIEPDPRWPTPGEPTIGAWQPGLAGLLAGALRMAPRTRVVAALVSGVLSRRARRVASVIAGRRGPTDALVPLLELTFSAFRDLDLRVRFGPVRELVRGRDPSASRDEALAAVRADLEGMAAEVG